MAAPVVRDRQIANMSGTGEPALQGRGMHGSRRALPRLDAFCNINAGEGQALALRYIKVLRTFGPCDGCASIDIKVLRTFGPCDC